MSSSPIAAEFNALTSRIKEIETALDVVFDELDEAAAAPVASTLKTLLARRSDLADQLADANRQLLTVVKTQVNKDRAEITKNMAETRRINAEMRQDLEDFYRNVLGSSANYANPTPIITIPIDATDDSVQKEESTTSPTSGDAVEAPTIPIPSNAVDDNVPSDARNEGLIASPGTVDKELTTTSPRSKRKGVCLEVTQDTGTVNSHSLTPTIVTKLTEYNALRLPLASIPNMDTQSPTTKRKHDVDAAEACLSGKEGGGEALPEMGTPAKRRKPAGPSRGLKPIKQTGSSSAQYIRRPSGHPPAKSPAAGSNSGKVKTGSLSKNVVTPRSASSSKSQVSKTAPRRS